MGIELELGVLLLIQLIGSQAFVVFEIETPAWRKILKWLMMDAVTLTLTIWLHHWALLFPFAILIAGTSYHIWFCKKHGIDLLKATPRKKYYELRNWKWPE